jgi:hypothetical protein
VTTPVLVNQDHGVPIYPPLPIFRIMLIKYYNTQYNYVLHPILKQEKNPQHAVVSAVDNGVSNYPLVLIHNLSLKASVVP